MNVVNPETVQPLWHDAIGDGPVLVLLHGWALNSRVFDSLAASLARRFRVVRIDLPGHGRSGESAALRERGWTPEMLAGEVAPLVPRGAIVLGWSLGGQVALALAADEVAAVGGLVLVSSTPRFVAAPESNWLAGLKPSVLAQFAKFLLSDPRGTVRDFLDLQVRGSRDAAQSLHALQTALERQGLGAPGALARGLDMLRVADLRPRLRDIRAPTLVIAGQYDRVTPPAAAQALAAGIAGAMLLELPRSGHAPFLSHEPEVVAAIDALRPAA
jgi:pimeloyl-[acyl-carrier protein] methyl ester esterase